MWDSAHSDRPQIRSRSDLTRGEVQDAETGKFLRSIFAHYDEHDAAWLGQVTGTRLYDLTLEDFKHHLERLPDDIVYPKATSAITSFSAMTGSSVFFKRPKLLHFHDQEVAKLLPRMLIEEAEVHEHISKHPHPNLVQYFGCTLKNGRVTGIALAKHEVILQYRHEDDPRELNTDACMEGIRAGIARLHALGFAHNDLNPTNIGFDVNDNPVIFDYGSCRRFGAQLITGGTPGWIDEDEDYETSEPHHDEIAIHKLGVWLREKKAEQEGNIFASTSENQHEIVENTTLMVA